MEEMNRMARRKSVMEKTRFILLRSEEKLLNKFISYTAYSLYAFVIPQFCTYLGNDHIKAFPL
jgi:hypothetical protein